MEGENNKLSKIEKRSESSCLADLSIENIVVYLEKAEITRSIKYEINEGQMMECTFEQFPSSIEKDSIRIEVANSRVSIQDVTFISRPINESTQQIERLKQLKELIRNEKQNQDSLEAKKSRLLKQKSVLDAFANTLIGSQRTTPETGTGDVLNSSQEKKVHNMTDAYNPKHLETVANFFQLYNDNGERFDENLLEIEEKIDLSKTKISCFECEVNDIRIRQDEQLYRELFVIVEGRMDGEFEMNISYVVNNCSWRPVYDVRVSNTTGSMQINYYGLVKQKCGEDWYHTSNMHLSTAEPGVGGTVPEVGVQKVQFKNSFTPSQEVPSQPPMSPALSNPILRKSASRLSSFRKSKAPSYSNYDFNTFDPSAPPVNVIEKDIQPFVDDKPSTEKIFGRQFDSMGVTFEVARPPSLLTCDNTEYRMMISVINLEPDYQHVTVPKFSPYAYLRSVSKNSSKFTLLEGPVNIYIDSNYIGKTQLSTVCPCEEFYCNLGVDKGVKINYMPMFKFRDSGQKNTCVTFKQEIHVLNNHERPIKILIIDQLPVSGDEKIKVTLIEPNIKNLDKYDKLKPVRINSNRQIEWDCDIGSKDRKEMVLKFTVEHPCGKDIEVIQIK